MATNLPYFDMLLEQLDRKQPNFQKTFGTHVHWGYWARPEEATGSFDDFATAADRMCERVCDSVPIAEGQEILDVGCGLGGTLASLNQRFERVKLVGLNIDARQLERAAALIKPAPSNTLTLTLGDACEMPFEDEKFDLIIALECAFHFPSRERFLAEVNRVLRPGGRLVLCDFMPAKRATPLLRAERLFFPGFVKKFVGRVDFSWTMERYVDEARVAGLTIRKRDDITQNVLPSYPVLRKLAKEGGRHVLIAAWGTQALQWLGRLGLLRYAILSFQKPKPVSAA